MLAGRLEEAQILAERALALARMHQRGNEVYALRLLGDIAARRDPWICRPGYRIHYSQALALAEALGMRPLQAHCHHGSRHPLRHHGQREQARAALSTAVEMYRAMDMTFWLPRPKRRWRRWHDPTRQHRLMSLSRLWQRQGKRAKARPLLAEVYNWFIEGFDIADLQEAGRLLDAFRCMDVIPP